jgi:hypothetical protein
MAKSKKPEKKEKEEIKEKKKVTTRKGRILGDPIATLFQE